MSSSVKTPFAFLKGEDECIIEHVHSIIKLFNNKGAEKADQAIAAFLPHKAAYSKFKDELMIYNIPMPIAELREEERREVLEWLDQNYTLKDTMKKRSLDQALWIVQQMLERHEKRMQESVQEDNYPCSCDNTPQQQAEPASQKSGCAFCSAEGPKRRGKTSRMSLTSPFTFLKGEDEWIIEHVHSIIKLFNKNNAVRIDQAVAAFLPHYTAAYSNFKDELMIYNIPMPIAELREEERREVLVEWLDQNYTMKDTMQKRSLDQALWIAQQMLERHEKRMQESVQEDNYPCSCDNTPQQPTEPASQESNRGSTPSAEFEQVDGSDCQQPLPLAAEESPPKNNPSLVYLDASSEFEQNAKQERVPGFQERFNTQSLLRGMQSPFDFLKGQDAESINMVHFAIRNFKQNPVLTDKTVELWLTDDNKKVYETFKKELQSGIPLELFSLRDSSARNAILQFIQSNVSAEAPRRTLAEVLKITNDMLKDFNSLEKPQRDDEGKPTSSLPVQTTTKTSKSKSNPINILLIGETEAGKTTFVNGFANYLKYSTFDDALSCDPIIVVRTNFSIVLEKDEPPVDIYIDPEYTPEGYINEQFAIKGQSRTQNAMIHKFSIEIHGEDLEVRLIDTPGVNDTRGANQDLINFYNTTHKIEDLGEIHAICIVMKPNEARMTKELRSTLDSLLSKLPKAAANNIVFCFTHTEPFGFLPGESLNSLKTYLNNLKDSSGVEIPLTEKNMFCVDNNSFRFQCTVKDHSHYLSKKENFRRIWVNNKRQLLQLLAYVQTLNPHITSEAASIARVDKCFQGLLDELVSVTKLHAQKIVKLRISIANAHFFPENDKKELDKRQEAFAYILTACSYFTEFLKRKAIGIQDYFGVQLQHLINDEQASYQFTKSAQVHAVLSELEFIFKEYKKKLNVVLGQSGYNECGQATPEEIEQILVKMRNLKYYGDKIPSIELFLRNNNHTSFF